MQPPLPRTASPSRQRTSRTPSKASSQVPPPTVCSCWCPLSCSMIWLVGPSTIPSACKALPCLWTLQLCSKHMPVAPHRRGQAQRGRTGCSIGSEVSPPQRAQAGCQGCSVCCQGQPARGSQQPIQGLLLRRAGLSGLLLMHHMNQWMESIRIDAFWRKALKLMGMSAIQAMATVLSMSTTWHLTWHLPQPWSRRASALASIGRGTSHTIFCGNEVSLLEQVAASLRRPYGTQPLR